VRDGGRPLNAFEIINAALDISALFERRSDVVKRHTRFTSRETPERIAEAIEAAHKHLGGTSERNSFKCAFVFCLPCSCQRLAAHSYTLSPLSSSKFVTVSLPAACSTVWHSLFI